MDAVALPEGIAARVDTTLRIADKRGRQTAFTTKDPVYGCWQSDELFVVAFGTPGFLKQLSGHNDRVGIPLPGVVVVEPGVKSGSLQVTPHGGPLLITGGGEIIGDLGVLTFEPGSDAFVRGMRITSADVPKYLIRAAYVAAIGGDFQVGSDHLWNALVASLAAAITSP